MTSIKDKEFSEDVHCQFRIKLKKNPRSVMDREVVPDRRHAIQGYDTVSASWLDVGAEKGQYTWNTATGLWEEIT